MMMDAYSLDADDAGLDAVYERVGEAYTRILTRCGLRYVMVNADAGEMGGRDPVEYHVLSTTGEDTLVLCPSCGYAANSEVAISGLAKRGDDRPWTMASATTTNNGDATAHSPASIVHQPAEEVATPNCATIADVAAFLGVPETATAKAVFFDTPEHGLVFAVVRGDLAVSEAKLRRAAGISALAPATTEQIAMAGAVAGYASPVGLMVLDYSQWTGDDGSTSHQPPATSQESSSTVDRPSSSIFVIADQSIVDGGPLVAGANRAGYHLRNLVYGRDWRATLVADIAEVRAGDPCARCGTPLTIEPGVEVGHIFKLGTRYSEALGARFLDQSGVEQTVVMGSYGLGLDRILQLILELHHDDKGIVWPGEVTPFDAYLIRLGKSEAVRAEADALDAELRAAGLRVLFDDRDETAGVKFNDADLIGLPTRVLISDRLLAEGQVELKPRTGAAVRVARAEACMAVRDAVRPPA
jgi:prolyl-tRNA synthetase